MIKCNLGPIMADRLTTGIAVSRATGISRTTILNLSKRRSGGIQFETLDALCQHLGCTVGEILEFVPDKEATP